MKSAAPTKPGPEALTRNAELKPYRGQRNRATTPDATKLDVKAALDLLADAETIHTFDASASIFAGCDMSRERLVQDIVASGGAQIVVGNHRMAGMGHNLLVQGERGAVFVEVDAARMAQILAAQVVSS